MMVVRPAVRRSRTSTRSASVPASSELVGSSKITIGASLRNAPCFTCVTPVRDSNEQRDSGADRHGHPEHQIKSTSDGRESVVLAHPVHRMAKVCVAWPRCALLCVVMTGHTNQQFGHLQSEAGKCFKTIPESRSDILSLTEDMLSVPSLACAPSDRRASQTS